MDRDALRAVLGATPALGVSGHVIGVTGLALRFTMPGVRVGDVVRVRRRGAPLECQVVGFAGGEAVALPFGDLMGVGPDDAVEALGPRAVAIGGDLLGRVVDGLGRPIDGGPGVQGALRPVGGAPPAPLERPPIDAPLPTGVRVLDALHTFGEGQRLGLFAGSGVGKSTLLGAVARGAAVDVVVVALIGERGREVVEFLERSLGEVGRKKSVVVVATSDAPALERIAAAEVATAIAEHFRDEGKRVLLLLDSITRYARAQREVGLAAGEPPTRRGYPPSVFAMLPRLLERAGRSRGGSITAVYTVLVEGGDLDEPVADEIRGILDGHIVLDRTLASRGRYPSVNPLVSLSRVMEQVVTPRHVALAKKLRVLLGAYEDKRDLIVLGAYAKGSDKLVDEALAKLPRLEAFLAETPGSGATLAETLEGLEKLVG